MDQRTACLGCGKSLTPGYIDSGAKRCARCAANHRLTLTCLTCGESLSDSRARKFCSVRCGDIHRGVVLAEPVPRRVCDLPGCGVEFQPMTRKQRCCCEDHGKKLCRQRMRAEGRDKTVWSDRRRDNYHRRRALKKATSSGDPVLLAEIARRDRWTCHLCRRPICMTVAWPDPLSPSLDHVVPLSRGGTHEPANVKLAHLSCNTVKGNREAA